VTTDVIASATERLHGRVIRTPLQQSRPLTERLGLEVLLKLENLQHTGSFKARGAVNKLLTIDPAAR
jgi:threonine dehydratase